MTTDRAVLITHNLRDYTLAAASHQLIAEREGLRACYPVQLPSRSFALPEPILSYYGIRTIDFAELLPAPDARTRSGLLRERYYNGNRSISVGLNASPESLAFSMLSSLAEGRPLEWNDSSAAESANAPVLQPDVRPEHVLVAERDSTLMLGAALYARSTDKRLIAVNSLDEFLSDPDQSKLASATLAADFTVFNKRMLERLASWRGAASVGILTAYSPAMFTALIWRALTHRDFNRDGRRSRMIPPLYSVDLRTSAPLEYYVLRDHGNESHMHHGQGDVLCGAIAPEIRSSGTNGFNCEWSCPHEHRFPASRVPAHYVIILSCSTLTLGDGLVPPEYSLLLNLLNGWPVSVIAPFQHAMTTPPLAILADALLQSGYTLGEVTRRLNFAARFGCEPDPSYMLLGDPEIAIAEHTRQTPVVTFSGSMPELDMKCSGVRGRVLECRLPDDASRALLAGGHMPAVIPQSGELKAAEARFGFLAHPGSPATDVMIFAAKDLPEQPFRIRIGVADSGQQARRLAADSVEAIRALRVFGFQSALIEKQIDSILSAIRSIAAYPAFLESVYGPQPGEGEFVLGVHLYMARQAFLQDLLERSAHRLWLNHHYANHYLLVRRVADEDFRGTCAVSGNSTYAWRYEDNCAGLPARDLVMCARCGVIADLPSSRDVEIELAPVRDFKETRHTQRVTFRNRGSRTVRLSWFVQLHQWRELGVEVRPNLSDVELESGAETQQEVVFDFARPLPDYIHDMMLYALSDRFELYCTSQKITSRGHGLFAVAQHAGRHGHELHAHHHTAAHKNTRAEPFLLLVEPHAVMYRYLQVARTHLRTLVLTKDPTACLSGERKYNLSMGLPNATQIDRLIQCDTTSVAAMERAIEPLRGEIAGVLAGHDSFVGVAASLGQALGFDYASAEDAVCHHLKTAMKRRFMERGVPTPRFFIVRSFEDALHAWEELGRDCMVKMVDATSSMNVFRVSSRSELESAWDRIVHGQRSTRTGFVRSPEVILEEFIGGRELSVEGYIQDDRLICLNFCEKLTEHHFIVVGHFLPAEVSEAEAEILSRTAEQCVRAVGMRNSVFHIEIHLCENRPYVIECASRPPGQHMVELMHRAYGYDLMGISIALATREPVHELSREPKRHFAMLAIYSPRRGTLEHVEGLEELKRRGGVAHVNIEAKPGDHIEVLRTFHQKYGFIILEDETAAGIREKAAWMRQNVRLVLAGDRERVVSPQGAGE